MNRRLARLQRDPHFDDARRCLGRRHSLTTGVLLDPLSTYGRHELAAETPLTYRLTDLPIELAPVSCAAEPTAAGAWRYTLGQRVESKRRGENAQLVSTAWDAKTFDLKKQ